MSVKISVPNKGDLTAAEFRAEFPQLRFSGSVPPENILRAAGATLVAAAPAPMSQAQLDAENTLTPQQFRLMMNLPRPGAPRGWGKVWEDVTDALRSSDPVRAAVLDSHHVAPVFRLSATLEMIALVKPITGQTHPNVDLSEATVRTAWQKAQTKDLSDI
jgi:hypothetical protein